jgi:hypothetical protein
MVGPGYKTMLRTVCFVIGLGLLAIGPALSDVVGVTVNGTASGTGYGETECESPDYTGPLPPGCVEEPGPFYVNSFGFNFSETNTQLGGFGASGYASGLNGAYIAGYASQDTTTTAGAIDILLTAGFLGGVLTVSDVSVQDNIVVSFDVTSQSEIQLTGDVLAGLGPNTGELLDSMGNPILGIPFAGDTSSAILQPGIYQLDVSIDESGPASGPYYYSYLNANFTTVPEPRSALLAALLTAMLGGYVMSRRRRAW